MKKYIARRILQLIPTLIGVSFISFFLMQLSVSDFVDIVYENTGTAVSTQAQQEIRQELGLDQPVHVQYIEWSKNLLKGDLGSSFSTGEDVASMLISKLPATILLSISSLLLTFIISIPLGITSALYQNRFIDNIIKAMSFIGSSLPVFIIAFILIYIFAINLNILPVISGDNIPVGIILPTLSLAIAMSSKYIRQVRTIVVDELESEYVIGLRSRGISEKNIVLKSVLKASMISIVTLFSLSFGSLLGGTAVIETIFMWDGLGKTAVDAMLVKDYPVVQAYVLLMTVLYIVINLVTDIFYRYIDPRLRIGEGDV